MQNSHVMLIESPFGWGCQERNRTALGLAKFNRIICALEQQKKILESLIPRDPYTYIYI